MAQRVVALANHNAINCVFSQSATSCKLHRIDIPILLSLTVYLFYGIYEVVYETDIKDNAKNI